MLYALLPRASFCIFNGWAEASKFANLGTGAFLIKIYLGAFAGLFPDSPFPNIMRVVEPHGMVSLWQRSWCVVGSWIVDGWIV